MFNLDAEQLKKLYEWAEKHDKTCPLAKYAGAVGGKYTYSFTPNSLGLVIVVQCACEEGHESKIDLTDYDW